MAETRVLDLSSKPVFASLSIKGCVHQEVDPKAMRTNDRPIQWILIICCLFTAGCASSIFPALVNAVADVLASDAPLDPVDSHSVPGVGTGSQSPTSAGVVPLNGGQGSDTHGVNTAGTGSNTPGVNPAGTGSDTHSNPSGPGATGTPGGIGAGLFTPVVVAAALPAPTPNVPTGAGPDLQAQLTQEQLCEQRCATSIVKPPPGCYRCGSEGNSEGDGGGGEGSGGGSSSGGTASAGGYSAGS